VQQPRQDVISVVIAWVNPLELLTPGLDALHQQSRRPDEIIVVTRHGSAQQKRLCATYPGVTLLAAPTSTSIPVLRSMGLKHASGTVVVVTEDHCVPSNDWISVVARQMQGDCGVVGGPVENDCTTRWRDWAAFLTEYAGAVQPAAAGPVADVPSNNAAYKRELIHGLCDTLDRGLWESFYYSQLAARGIVIISVPEMVVHHRRPFDFWYFIGQRYHFCRSFAGMRCQSFTHLDRFTYAVGSLLLPPLLLLRGLRTLVRKGRLVGRYVCCLPLIGMYVTVGAVGEMMGYLGGGGRSLELVE